MSIQINVFASRSIIPVAGRPLIFSLDCSDQDYFSRNAEFLSYPIKDSILEALTDYKEWVNFFVFEIAIQEHGLKVNHRGIISRETTDRVSELHRVIEVVLENNFENLRQEMRAAYFKMNSSEKEN